MQTSWFGPLAAAVLVAATPSLAASPYLEQDRIVWRSAEETYQTPTSASTLASVEPSSPSGLVGLLFGQRPAASRDDSATRPAGSFGYRRVSTYPRQVVYNDPSSGGRMVPRGQYQPQHLQPEPDPRFARQEVSYDGSQAVGTVVIDTASKYLYLVQGHGRALRYGIGVGRPGFVWSGVKTITRKSEWPAWTPPAEMLKRRPELPIHMEGGPANPLGARAMYLGSSLYRIHGTNEPETIGTNVSSGCIRMMNTDVIDLYDRVRVGTRVVVI